MKETKQIMYDSDESAQRTTVTGWVSRNGQFWRDDEHMARYCGCTHMRCVCGQAMEKHWRICEDCRGKESLEKYEAMPVVEWDGETPLAEFDGDKYFFSEDDVYDYCENHGIALEDLWLVICEPAHAREINIDDYCQDQLAEDQSLEDVYPELHEAVVKLNEMIHKDKRILSWFPSNKRVTLTPLEDRP